MKVDEKRLGLTVGILFAALHFVMVLVIEATGGKIVDAAASLHGLGANAVHVPIGIYGIVGGTALAALIGLAIGAVAGMLWNGLGN